MTTIVGLVGLVILGLFIWAMIEKDRNERLFGRNQHLLDNLEKANHLAERLQTDLRILQNKNGFLATEEKKLRRILYQCPAAGEVYQQVTDQMEAEAFIERINKELPAPSQPVD